MNICKLHTCVRGHVHFKCMYVLIHLYAVHLTIELTLSGLQSNKKIIKQLKLRGVKQRLKNH